MKYSVDYSKKTLFSDNSWNIEYNDPYRTIWKILEDDIEDMENYVIMKCENDIKIILCCFRQDNNGVSFIPVKKNDLEIYKE